MDWIFPAVVLMVAIGCPLWLIVFQLGSIHTQLRYANYLHRKQVTGENTIPALVGDVPE